MSRSFLRVHFFPFFPHPPCQSPCHRCLSSSVRSLPASPPPRWVVGNSAHAPSAPLPLYPPSTPACFSFSPITSPGTDTHFSSPPQSQLWSPAPSAQGKMRRGEARGEGEGRSTQHPASRDKQTRGGGGLDRGPWRDRRMRGWACRKW